MQSVKLARELWRRLTFLRRLLSALHAPRSGQRLPLSPKLPAAELFFSLLLV
jgi:hypothetical protein